MREWTVSLLVLLSAFAPVVAAERVTQIEFLGEARLDRGLSLDGMPVGGLSGVTYDSMLDRYHVVSDDPSGRAPARFYTLTIDLDGGRLRPDAVEVQSVTVLRSPDGSELARLTLDPEGIALTDRETLFVSSEGQIRRGIGPFLREFRVDGSMIRELELPGRYLPGEDGSTGPRHNLVFEGLTLTPDGRRVFVGMENSLVEDGPAASLESGSLSRLLEFDAASGDLLAEYIYPTEPVAESSTVEGGIEVNGLVEILALDQRRLLALERSFSAGVGNTIRLFEIDLRSATNVAPIPSLRDEAHEVVPVQKRLLLDLAALGRYLDNLEGMTFGPELDDGRRSLVMVSDDNFNPVVQVGQVLAFALSTEPVTVETVQGADHLSPLEGRWVLGVRGVVTAVGSGGEGELWIEMPVGDRDPATSRGVRVQLTEGASRPEPGAAIEIDGRVREHRRREGELSVTTVEATRVRSVASDALPPPVRLEPGGRGVPRVVVDDDRLRAFEPEFDGLDFWESLEGMRVLVPSPVVVGPTNRFGDLTVLAGRRGEGEATTSAGGVLLRPGDPNPERLGVVPAESDDRIGADVGDRFVGDLSGVLTYAFGRYRLLALESLPDLDRRERGPETTELGSRTDGITIASFNVYNLSPETASGRLARLAEQLVSALRSPAIVALQEIQDDSGPVDDGTVGAARTLASLVAAISAAGGPRYEFRQIDPLDKMDGGYPGSNIRVAFLFDPLRVAFEDLGQAGAEDGLELIRGDEGVHLNANPVRLAPGAAAFRGDLERGFSPSRKPLVAEFAVGQERLFLVNLHLSSKSGDDRIFGSVQPPVRSTEDQRSQQALWVARFVRDLLNEDPQAAVVVLGDLNDHEFRSPLRILEAVPLVNMIERVPAADRYTFVYNGNSQVLDHVLVSEPLSERAELAIDVVHLNADFRDELRSSDHDPVVLEVRFRQANR